MAGRFFAHILVTVPLPSPRAAPPGSSGELPLARGDTSQQGPAGGGRRRGCALAGTCKRREDGDSPPEILESLAEDEDVVVRALVASHPGCPSETLALLVEDDDLMVVGVALSNPYLPREARDKALEAERRGLRQGRSVL